MQSRRYGSPLVKAGNSEVDDNRVEGVPCRLSPNRKFIYFDVLMCGSIIRILKGTVAA